MPLSKQMQRILAISLSSPIGVRIDRFDVIYVDRSRLAAALRFLVVNGYLEPAGSTGFKGTAQARAELSRIWVVRK